MQQCSEQPWCKESMARTMTHTVWQGFVSAVGSAPSNRMFPKAGRHTVLKR